MVILRHKHHVTRPDLVRFSVTRQPKVTFVAENELVARNVERYGDFIQKIDTARHGTFAVLGRYHWFDVRATLGQRILAVLDVGTSVDAGFCHVQFSEIGRD